MSQSVNVKFAKCFILFMAITILVQGAVYLGLSIWGIMLHNCSGENSDLVNHPFEFVVDLVYFSSETCGEPKLHIGEGIPDMKLDIDFTVAESITVRELIFLILYITTSALWVITSLLVLVTICCRVTAVITAFCFLPWFISVLAGSILDAVATGFHIHDIMHTTSAESTFEYVGVKNVQPVIEFIQGYDLYFMTPAVAFTCISSRVVLVWLLNIFGSIFCFSLARSLSANTTKKEGQEQQHRLPIDTTIPAQPQRQLPQNDEDQMREIQRQETVVLRYNPTAPPPDSVRKDRRTLEPLKSPQEQSQPVEYVAQYPPPMYRQQSSTNNKRVNELKTQASIKTDTPSYLSSDSHPEYLDYPNDDRNSSTPSLPTPRSATPELSAISPLNMRYSTTEGLAFANQPHVSQELRGQLPWSYTNIMNDPVAQKRIQAHLQPDDEDLPHIPVPDYTLHHPKKERETISPDRQSQTTYSRW